RPERCAAQVHDEEVDGHRCAAECRSHDVLDGGIDQSVVRVQQAISQSQERDRQSQVPSPLADCYVGERNGSQRSQGGDQHAPIGATSDDGIAPEAAEAPAGRATYQEDRACRQVRIAQIEAVDSLEKCRKKSGNCVEVEVDKNSGRYDPPESGHTEQLPNRTLGPRRMALSSSAFGLAKQKYYRGQEQSR